jgi:hypothetical protein
MAIDANKIGKDLIAAAAQVAKDSWKDIEKSAKIFLRAYAQSIADIAKGIAQGPEKGISAGDGKVLAESAKVFLVMAMASLEHQTLVTAQRLVDATIAIVKDAINGAIGVDLL